LRNSGGHEETVSVKRVGIRDVAAAAGVSISTVSNALNRPDMVSDELVARVRKFADELGCAPRSSCARGAAD
jgi:DNA-binding LacI/PurR family transcriptional regulator